MAYLLSALGQKQTLRLLDHLIGASEERWRDRHT